MPIAKSVTPTVADNATTEVNPADLSPGFTSESVRDIPINLYSFFNIDMASGDGKDYETLKDTYGLIKGELDPDATTGDVMAKLRDIERRLTPTQIGESRIGKVYNWLKLNNSIKETRKQQETLETRGII